VTQIRDWTSFGASTLEGASAGEGQKGERINLEEALFGFLS
jgi:hypothetical protein